MKDELSDIRKIILDGPTDENAENAALDLSMRA